MVVARGGSYLDVWGCSEEAEGRWDLQKRLGEAGLAKKSKFWLKLQVYTDNTCVQSHQYLRYTNLTDCRCVAVQLPLGAAGMLEGWKGQQPPIPSSEHPGWHGQDTFGVSIGPCWAGRPRRAGRTAWHCSGSPELSQACLRLKMIWGRSSSLHRPFQTSLTNRPERAPPNPSWYWA